MRPQSKPRKKNLHEEEVEQAILEYFAEHPRASDRIDGIAEWWIMRRQVRVEIELLAEVLRQLTAAGLLEKIGDGDKALYRLKSDKQANHSS